MESFYSVHPDVVSSAIKGLAWALGVTGAALISTLLYIWHKTDKRIDSIDDNVKSIAKSLAELKNTSSVEIEGIKRECLAKHNAIEKMLEDRRYFHGN